MIQRLRQMRNEEGFTLIELLIVIIVLGILAAIVVFAVGNTRDDATAATCNTDVKSIQLSAEAIKTKSGSYPTAATDLDDPTKGGLLKGLPAGIAYTSDGSTYTITPDAAKVAAGCAVVSG